MIEILCLISVAGFTGQQKIPFEFTQAEASKFMHGYGYFAGFTPSDLQKKACQNLEWTLTFFEDEE